jgi:NADH-quinone oxidoreductase subunit L
MTMTTAFIHFFILLPAVGFVITMLIPVNRETLLSRSAFFTVGLHMIGAQGFIVHWMWSGSPTIDVRDLVFFQTAGYEFFLGFNFDKVAAVYLFVGSLLTFLVTTYSRYYLHREEGYRRFFNAILSFYFGYNVVILAGNLETLFIGWEILGISSFLLIAFYRNRYLPVKNAVKVFSIYRVGDVGILLAMWMSHHLWHESVTFSSLSNYDAVSMQLESHTSIGVFISLMFLLTAAAKSAQLPFSSWLPRAMEGPTPSSAIFYGALSAHLGVFFLLRTFTFWEHQVSVRIAIGLVGLLTAIVATGIARIQSSVKSQIAYASISQIGLIFIELSLGFENLALFHFAGNAFLRTYQLLVSPSVVSYLIREQFYNFSPHKRSTEDSFPKKVQHTLYILCTKEWNLDSYMYRYLWNPLKRAGAKLNFVSITHIVIFFICTYAFGALLLVNSDCISESTQQFLSILFSFVALLMVLKSFTERKRARKSWVLIIINHFYVALAISFNDTFDFEHIIVYLSGIVVSGLFGYLCLYWVRLREGDFALNQFNGHSYKYPRLAFIFLLTCLGVTGFPITPTFIGEDLIFSHIREDQVILASFTALSFILDGLAAIRIFARVFMGPHVKSMYEMAYRSS